jgi:hypothetical protein
MQDTQNSLAMDTGYFSFLSLGFGNIDQSMPTMRCLLRDLQGAIPNH